MNYVILVLTAITLTYGGMAALALAIDRHHRQAYGADATRRTRLLLRCVGAVLLLLAIPPCVQLWGPGAGMVAWTGMLTVGALPPAIILPYWPRKLAPSASGAAAFGIIGLGALALA
jgi:hypothetical protein